MINYYEVLEIERTATEKEIKSAYRKLAKKWHPDTTQFDKEYAANKFKEITIAYNILADLEKRKNYDYNLDYEIRQEAERRRQEQARQEAERRRQEQARQEAERRRQEQARQEAERRRREQERQETEHRYQKQARQGGEYQEKQYRTNGRSNNWRIKINIFDLCKNMMDYIIKIYANNIIAKGAVMLMISVGMAKYSNYKLILIQIILGIWMNLVAILSLHVIKESYHIKSEFLSVKFKMSIIALICSSILMPHVTLTILNLISNIYGFNQGIEAMNLIGGSIYKLIDKWGGCPIIFLIHLYALYNISINGMKKIYINIIKNINNDTYESFASNIYTK